MNLTYLHLILISAFSMPLASFAEYTEFCGVMKRARVHGAADSSGNKIEGDSIAYQMTSASFEITVDNDINFINKDGSFKKWKFQNVKGIIFPKHSSLHLEAPEAQDLLRFTNLTNYSGNGADKNGVQLFLERKTSTYTASFDLRSDENYGRAIPSENEVMALLYPAQSRMEDGALLNHIPFRHLNYNSYLVSNGYVGEITFRRTFQGEDPYEQTIMIQCKEKVYR